MKITVTEKNAQTTIALEGMLDSSSAARFQEIVNQQLVKENINLVIDLAELMYTSSQGLRTILTLIKTVMSKNGKLVFRNIQPAVQEVLDMAGISQAMVVE